MPAFVVCLALLAGACRGGVPAADMDPTLARASGTISGTIRGPQVAAAATGRTVEAVNVATGERRRARTNAIGAYTFELPAGTWRIEPSLTAGERIDRAPEPVPLEPGELKTDVDVVVGGQRPPSRTPEGLAPPFAVVLCR